MLTKHYLNVYDAYITATTTQSDADWRHYYQTCERYYAVYDDRVRAGHEALTLNGEA